jgi:transcriptional regulator
MYIPNHFREEDRDKLVAFMRANSFGILITQHDGAPFATHLPLVVDDSSEAIVIRGHVAKANPQWHGFANQPTPNPSRQAGGEHPIPLPFGERLGERSVLDALVIFHGPHAYVSPTFYDNPQSVPTWNYIAVHAYGAPYIVNTTEAKESMLAELIAQYEAAHQQQWAAQTEKYRQGMLNGIIAFEIEVTRLEGKYKLSQNRPEGDQQRVAAALAHSKDPTVNGIAEAMMEANA